MERYLNTITMLFKHFRWDCRTFIRWIRSIVGCLPLFLIIVDFITGWIKAIATKRIVQSDWYARNCEKK